MKKASAKDWFVQKITRDLFVVFAAMWGVLFVMELTKEGIVSNYLPLPHLAVFLVVLGVIAMIFQPVNIDIKPTKFSRSEILILLILSIIVALLIPLVLDVSSVLTLVLIFVTVLTIWVGTFEMKQPE